MVIHLCKSRLTLPSVRSAYRPSLHPLAITATDQRLNSDVIHPGDSLTITVKVSAFKGIPQGSVKLYDSGGSSTLLVASPQLDNTGTATYTTNGLQSGFHDFYAHFTGDSTYAASTSLINSVVVTGNPIVSITLASSPNPAALHQTVALTATVTASNPAPTGDVVFLDSGTMIGSATLNSSGVAVFNTTALILGVHSLSAVYLGDGHYVSQRASTTELIAYPAVQVTLTSSLNPATIGQSVTFTAKATASGPSPTGNVSLSDNGILVAPVPLTADGSATYATSTLTVGSHLIRAAYSGDALYAPQTGTLTEVVLAVTAPPPAPVDFTLTAGPSLTLNGRQNGTSTLAATPFNGLTDNVALSCGVLPLYVTCQIAPSSVVLDGASTKQASLQIATGQSPAYLASNRYNSLLLAALPLLVLPWRRKLLGTRIATFLLLIPLLSSLAGCGFNRSPLFTPPGTYSIVLHGESTITHLSRTATLTLVVQ